MAGPGSRSGRGSGSGAPGAGRFGGVGGLLDEEVAGEVSEGGAPSGTRTKPSASPACLVYVIITGQPEADRQGVFQK